MRNEKVSRKDLINDNIMYFNKKISAEICGK